MIKYLINNKEVEREKFEGELIDTVNKYCTETYDNSIDELEDKIEILGMNFNPSEVLRKVNPLYYQACLYSYQGATYDMTKEDLENTGSALVGNTTFKVINETGTAI